MDLLQRGEPLPGYGRSRECGRGCDGGHPRPPLPADGGPAGRCASAGRGPRAQQGFLPRVWVEPHGRVLPLGAGRRGRVLMGVQQARPARLRVRRPGWGGGATAAEDHRCAGLRDLASGVRLCSHSGHHTHGESLRLGICGKRRAWRAGTCGQSVSPGLFRRTHTAGQPLRPLGIRVFPQYLL